MNKRAFRGWRVIDGEAREPKPSASAEAAVLAESPGTYYVVERWTEGGWKPVTGNYRSRVEASWARAKFYVDTPALSISATRVTELSWS
jgi:hypothetical protein